MDYSRRTRSALLVDRAPTMVELLQMAFWYRQGMDQEQTISELQDELDHIGGWCAETGALINPSKATLTLFSLNNHIIHINTLCHYAWRVTRKIALSELPRCYFLKSMCFKEHIDHTIITLQPWGWWLLLTATRRHNISVVPAVGTFCSRERSVTSNDQHGANWQTWKDAKQGYANRSQCTRNTAITAMWYQLEMPNIRFRRYMC